MEKICKRFDKPLISLSPEVVNAFMEYAWPGNVREMQNIIEGGIQLASDNIITYDLVNDYFAPRTQPIQTNTDKTGTVAGVEKQMILDCLTKYKYNKTEVAKALGMSRRTLYRRLAEYDIME